MNDQQPNNTVIDRPNYYDLPCGRQLEDFIWLHRNQIDFFVGCAIKYGWRAGKKNLESKDKDLSKRSHYTHLISCRDRIPLDDVERGIDDWIEKARTWDGKDHR